LAALKNQRESFRFTWQLPDSPLRQILEKSMDVRGLHQIGVEDLEARSLRLCNTDKKTVSFLNIQQSTNRQNGNQRTIVRIKEVRGYSKWFKRAVKILESSGALQLDTVGDLFPFVLEGTGRKPLDYCSGYAVPLASDMMSIDAIRRIYTFLLDGIRRNEGWVVADLIRNFFMIYECQYEEPVRP